MESEELAWTGVNQYITPVLPEEWDGTLSFYDLNDILLGTMSFLGLTPFVSLFLSVSPLNLVNTYWKAAILKILC